MLGLLMAENNNVGEPKTQSTIESIKGLACYFVTLGYNKCIEQFVTPKFYDGLKLVSLTIIVTKKLVVKIFMLNFHLHDLYSNKKNYPYVKLQLSIVKK
jgi:hypothetical protein